MTTDIAKATRFYAELFGWDVGVSTVGESDRATIRAGGDEHGGMVALDATGAGLPHWLPHVLVDDADASARRAGELGGRLDVPPDDVPDGGRFAIVSDPQGARIAVVSGRVVRHPPSGTFVWDELMTSRVEDAERFYAELFGWESVEAHVGPSGTYWFFTDRGDDIAGLMEKLDYLAVPIWVPYFGVEDVDAVAHEARALAGTIAFEPTQVVGVGRFAIVADPTGAVFGLYRADS